MSRAWTDPIFVEHIPTAKSVLKRSIWVFSMVVQTPLVIIIGLLLWAVLIGKWFVAIAEVLSELLTRYEDWSHGIIREHKRLRDVFDEAMVRGRMNLTPTTSIWDQRAHPSKH